MSASSSSSATTAAGSGSRRHQPPTNQLISQVCCCRLLARLPLFGAFCTQNDQTVAIFLANAICCSLLFFISPVDFCSSGNRQMATLYLDSCPKIDTNTRVRGVVGSFTISNDQLDHTLLQILNPTGPSFFSAFCGGRLHLCPEHGIIISISA